MKTIVFIGTNKSSSSYEAIVASESMKFYTVLLTDRTSFIERRLDFPHVHLMLRCELSNPEEIRAAIGRLIENRLEITAIVSFIEPYCHTAAILSREYGLKAFSEQTIALMLDKIKSREILNGSPYSPPYWVVTRRDLLDIKALDEMPLVLKSPLSCASKDVYMAWTYPQYVREQNRLRRKYPDKPVLVEKFLQGPQYLAETLTVGGGTRIVAVIEQEITFTGRFIVTGYKMLTDETSGLRASLDAAVRDIVRLHGMRDGPCHLELRRAADGEWKLIEANPRIAGGAMNQFIETAYGVNLAKETLRFALGMPPELGHKFSREAFLQYVVVPEAGTLLRATGKNIALSCPGVEQVFVRPRKGSVLLPPFSMGNRYAYVIATGASAEEARGNAKTGAAQIKFHLRAPGALDLSEADREALDEMRRDAVFVEGLEEFRGNVVMEG